MLNLSYPAIDLIPPVGLGSSARVWVLKRSYQTVGQSNLTKLFRYSLYEPDHNVWATIAYGHSLQALPDIS
jgi:hypothetical protein